MNVSTRHVFQILRLVCTAERPTGAAEIHEALKLPSSTIHRALASLEEEGFIARYRGLPRYVIGHYPQHLAHALFNLFPLRHALHGRLRDAAVAGKLTLLLTMRAGWYGMKVAVFEGTNQVFHAGALGETRLLIDDDAGRAMLAAMDEAQRKGLRDFLARHWPERDLPRRAAAGKQLDEEGWSWLHLPVRNASGQVFAAVSGGAPGDAGGDESARTRKLKELVAAIEALVAEQPDLAWSPLGHLAADELMLGPPTE